MNYLAQHVSPGFLCLRHQVDKDNGTNFGGLTLNIFATVIASQIHVSPKASHLKIEALHSYARRPVGRSYDLEPTIPVPF